MRATKERTGVASRHARKRVPRAQVYIHLETMEGLMGAAKDAMGGGEAPPHDPAEAEARGRVDSPRRQQTRR